MRCFGDGEQRPKRKEMFVTATMRRTIAAGNYILFFHPCRACPPIVIHYLV